MSQASQIMPLGKPILGADGKPISVVKPQMSTDADVVSRLRGLPLVAPKIALPNPWITEAIPIRHLTMASTKNIGKRCQLAAQALLPLDFKEVPSSLEMPDFERMERLQMTVNAPLFVVVHNRADESALPVGSIIVIKNAASSILDPKQGIVYVEEEDVVAATDLLIRKDLEMIDTIISAEEAATETYWWHLYECADASIDFEKQKTSIKDTLTDALVSFKNW